MWCLPNRFAELALILPAQLSPCYLLEGTPTLGTLEAPITVSSVTCPHPCATLHSRLRLTDTCQSQLEKRGSELAHLSWERRVGNSRTFSRYSPVLRPRCFFFPRADTPQT